MAAPVLRVTSDGAARVVSAFGDVRVVNPNPDVPWPGYRDMTITASGERTVHDEDGRAPVFKLAARVGEQTDVTLTLKENGTALGDLSAAVVGWVAEARTGETISGDATGTTGGSVTLNLDIPSDATYGLYNAWIQVDGVTWPTQATGRNQLQLLIEKDV